VKWETSRWASYKDVYISTKSENLKLPNNKGLHQYRLNDLLSIIEREIPVLAEMLD